jgi:hypothetical protein
VIATTTYDDPQFRPLRAPATDAVELGVVLADPAIGGFEVTSVVNQPAGQVRIAIEEFLSGRTPDEFVVVYVSCHGVTDARRRLHFAATDTFMARLASTGVDSSWVHDLMEQCRARRQVLILDCCFSGAFARGAKGAAALGLDHLTEPGRGRVVLTASNATEYSFETPATGEPRQDSPASGSVFTAALIAGLRDGSADVDGDGYVTVDEAYAYAYQQVRALGAAQTPQRWVSGGEGQLILARNPTGRPLVPAKLPIQAGASSVQRAGAEFQLEIDNYGHFVGGDREQAVDLVLKLLDRPRDLRRVEVQATSLSDLAYRQSNPDGYAKLRDGVRLYEQALNLLLRGGVHYSWQWTLSQLANAVLELRTIALPGPSDRKSWHVWAPIDPADVLEVLLTPEDEEVIGDMPPEEPIWLAECMSPGMVWERVVPAVAVRAAKRATGSQVDISNWIISNRFPSELKRTEPAEPAGGWIGPTWSW